MTIRAIVDNERVGGLEMDVNKEYEKVIVLSDIHAPAYDKKTYSMMMRVLKDQHPDVVVYIGDIVDMYSVSKFDKDPTRAHNLQAEFDVAHSLLRRAREAVGEDTRMVLIEGNHEHRLDSYLKRHPELHGLRDLSVKSQLRLNDLNVEYMTELFYRGKFLFTHGKRFGMYASRWELADNGVSGMCGHSHRIGSFSKKDRTGVKSWHHIGHMTDEVAAGDYRPNPDWQQGFGIVYFHKRSPMVHSQAIPIIHHQAILEGKLYTPKSVKLLK